jgi:hypothetical protein
MLMATRGPETDSVLASRLSNRGGSSPNTFAESNPFVAAEPDLGGDLSFDNRP